MPSPYPFPGALHLRVCSEHLLRAHWKWWKTPMVYHTPNLRFLPLPLVGCLFLASSFSDCNSSKNSRDLNTTLSRAIHFVSPPRQHLRHSAGKWSNFSFVRSSASWFFSWGIHWRFNSQPRDRRVSESSITKSVRGYFVLIILLTA